MLKGCSRKLISNQLPKATLRLRVTSHLESYQMTCSLINSRVHICQINQTTLNLSEHLVTLYSNLNLRIS